MIESTRYLRLISRAVWLIILGVGPTTSSADAAEAHANRKSQRLIDKAGAPTLDPSLSAPQRFVVIAAHSRAVKNVSQRPTCGALFDDLALDAMQALSQVHYERARKPGELALCKRGISAVTSVHGKRTRLCDRFSQLSPRERAAVLIHEAMHHAGMSEWPADPEAPTSQEITELVREACSL